MAEAVYRPGGPEPSRVSSPYAFSLFCHSAFGGGFLSYHQFFSSCGWRSGEEFLVYDSGILTPQLVCDLSFPPLSVWAGAGGFHFSTLFEAGLPVRGCFCGVGLLGLRRAGLFVRLSIRKPLSSRSWTHILRLKNGSLDARGSASASRLGGFCIYGCGVRRVGIGGW